MKASKLIKELEKLVKKHGDLNVKISYRDSDEGTITIYPDAVYLEKDFKPPAIVIKG